MVEWGGGGRVLRGPIDVGAPPPRRHVAVRPARASLVIGYEVSASDAAEAFARIEIPSEKRNGAVVVEVPSFRPDIEREEDLIEEIARVQGYEALRSTLPGIRQAGGLDAAHAFRRRIRQALVRGGLREALSLSFASRVDLELMSQTEGVAVANPPSADEPFLRRSLVPNLLKALSRTVSRGGRGATLYEVGHVFHPADPVDEREVVAAVLAGPGEEGPHGRARPIDFFDGKGTLEALLSGLAIGEWRLGEPPSGPWHPGRSARVEIGGADAGVLGELHPRIAQRFDLPPRVAVFELDVAILAERAANEVGYREIPRYPPIRRDVAFTVDASTPAGDVQAALEGRQVRCSVRRCCSTCSRATPCPPGRRASPSRWSSARRTER